MKISYGESEGLNFVGSLVRISSYTAALGWIALMKAIINVGMSNIYYMDTDSIICSK